MSLIRASRKRRSAKMPDAAVTSPARVRSLRPPFAPAPASLIRLRSAPFALDLGPVDSSARTGERLDEEDRPRLLIAGDVGPDQVDKLLLFAISARFELDHGADGFSPASALDADHAYL